MPASSLAETQRYLWRLITAPEGVAAGLAAMRDEEPQLAELLGKIVVGDSRLDAAQRLDVYANMYFYRILDSIKEDHPSLLAVVGDTEFHNLVTDYLICHPSEHWSLRYAARHLPEFMRDHRLTIERPWLPALAQLDAEDSPVLSASDLERLAPEEWAEACFIPTPSVQLLELDWKIDEVWDRAQRNEPPGDGEAQPSAIQVWRRDLRVFHRVLEPLERDCLRLLLEREPFAAWCERASELEGDENAGEAVTRLLYRWLDEGVLSRVETANGGQRTADGGQAIR